MANQQPIALQGKKKGRKWSLKLGPPTQTAQDKKNIEFADKI